MTRTIEGLSQLHHRPRVEKSTIFHSNEKYHLPHYRIEVDHRKPWIGVTKEVHPLEDGLAAIIPRVIDDFFDRSRMPNILLFHQGTPSGIATRNSGFPFTDVDLEEAKSLHPDFSKSELAEYYRFQSARTDGSGYDLNRSFDPEHIHKHPEATLYDQVLKDHTEKHGPLGAMFYFHQDEDLRKPDKHRRFYVYFHGNRSKPFPVDFELTRKAMKKIKVDPYNGLDDPKEPDLDNMVENGVVISHPDEMNAEGELRYTALMDNYMINRGYTDHGVTIEFPMADKKTLRSMVEVIFEQMIFPLTQQLMQ